MLSFDNLVSTVFNIIKYFLHRCLVVEVTAQFAEIVHRKTAYPCVAPCGKFTVTVFTDNKCVDTPAVNIKVLT